MSFPKKVEQPVVSQVMRETYEQFCTPWWQVMQDRAIGNDVDQLRFYAHEEIRREGRTLKKG